MSDEKTLEQRWWIGRRKFRIGEDGVHVSYTQLMSTQKFRVPFENIPTDTVETTKRHPIWLILGMVCVAFTILGITLNLEKGQTATAVQMGAIWGALALTAAAAFVLTRQELIAFDTGDASLVFFASSPSRERVSAFLSVVIDARDEYLRARYQGPVAGESPIDAIERLAALRERQVISQDEFDALKARIVGAAVGSTGGGNGGTYL